MRNWNVTEDDGFGSVLLSSGFGSVSTVTVGYPVPLVFRDTLVLRANIGANDTGINQITAETLHGTHLAESCC